MVNLAIIPNYTCIGLTNSMIQYDPAIIGIYLFNIQNDPKNVNVYTPDRVNVKSKMAAMHRRRMSKK